MYFVGVILLFINHLVPIEMQFIGLSDLHRNVTINIFLVLHNPMQLS